VGSFDHHEFVKNEDHPVATAPGTDLMAQIAVQAHISLITQPNIAKTDDAYGMRTLQQH
jgi:hypothetical protein